MSIYDFIKTKLGDWIEVNDLKNEWTINDFSYETGVTGAITAKHCAKCIAINKCWFKNESDKKPEPHNIVFDLVSPVVGLYHPYCHCKESYMIAPSVDEIKVIIPEKKDWWLFTDKLGLIKAWGYNADSSIIEEISRAVKEAYINGNYSIRSHTKYGVNISLYLKINGVNEKQGRIYNAVSSFMIFPQGKLKCNTLIGGIKNEITR